MKNKTVRFVVDEGNSLVKIAVFDKEKPLFFSTNDHLSEEFLAESLLNVGINSFDGKPKAIFSSVRDNTTLKQELLSGFFDTLYFSHHTPVPVNNLYGTPETLGLDRLAATIGAAYLFPDRDNLVIDAGTCITYDFIDKSGNYSGGGIMPGLQMKLRALHTFTEKLPLLSVEFAPGLCGHTTKEAILAGTVNGTLLELDGIINDFRLRFPDLQVVLCGGDSALLQDKLKNDTFAEPKLVLYGLMQILDFNENL